MSRARLFMRRALLVAPACMLSVSGLCATVSGNVTIPTADGGYRAQISGTKIRVEGTALSADVVATDAYSGQFTLVGVPSGPITLRLEEPQQGGIPNDAFAAQSKILSLNVSGDVGNASFSLSYHWQNLLGYPPPWRTPGYQSEWTPFFLSDQKVAKVVCDP